MFAERESLCPILCPSWETSPTQQVIETFKPGAFQQGSDCPSLRWLVFIRELSIAKLDELFLGV